MTIEKYSVFVQGSVVFITHSKQDADRVVRSLQQVQELTFGLNGYIFDVELVISQNTTPNYSWNVDI